VCQRAFRRMCQRMHAPGACLALPATVAARPLLENRTVLGKEEVSCAGRQDAARVGARGAAATGLLPRVCAGEVMQAAPRAGSAACLSPAEPAVPALCGLQAHAAVLARQHVIACVQSGGHSDHISVAPLWRWMSAPASCSACHSVVGSPPRRPFACTEEEQEEGSRRMWTCIMTSLIE